MSAFVCSSNHIAILAKYCHENDIYVGHQFGEGSKQSDLIAKAFAVQNIVSVDYRYPDNENEPWVDNVFIDECMSKAPKADLNQYDAITIFKLAECLAYQSCEHKNYKDFDAYRMVEQIKTKSITQVKGYDSAPWGIE